jgi:peptidoglycan/xylan/chitin deacetylase (PgdA/CDA1 family)
MLADWIQARRGYLSGWKWSYVRRHGVRVFRYHGVVEQKRDLVLDRNQIDLDVFRAQMDYLRRFRVLGIGDLVEDLSAGKLPRWPSAMVTFDDGFHNNMLAAEILAPRRIPWSLYVPPGEVGASRAMWAVEVSLLVMQGRAATVAAFGRTWSLATRADREKSFREMRLRLKAVPAAVRLETVEALRRQFPAGESERLLADQPQLRMLTWEELSQLSSSGVEIGSHGLHHEIHHADQPAELRVRELVASRSELERRLGRPCRAFAYPNGNFVEASPREVETAGYDVAFTTVHGALESRSSAERFLLPRLSASGSLHGFVRNFWWDGDQPARRSQAPQPRPSEA